MSRPVDMLQEPDDDVDWGTYACFFFHGHIDVFDLDNFSSGEMDTFNPGDSEQPTGKATDGEQPTGEEAIGADSEQPTGEEAGTADVLTTDRKTTGTEDENGEWAAEIISHTSRFAEATYFLPYNLS